MHECVKRQQIAILETTKGKKEKINKPHSWLCNQTEKIFVPIHFHTLIKYVYNIVSIERTHDKSNQRIIILNRRKANNNNSQVR